MRNRFRITNAASIVLIASLLIGFAPASAQEKVTVLRYSSFFPAPHELGMLAAEWAKEVEKRTSGRVKVNYYPGGTLTPPQQTYDSILNGIADVGLTLPSYTLGRFPLTYVIELPLGAKNAAVATHMANEYYNTFKPKELDSVKVLYFFSSGPMLLHSRRPVNTMKDWKGLKVRSTGASAALVKLMGGSPVGMPMSEAYDALSKGVTDSILSSNETLKGFRLAEVTAHTVRHYASASCAGFFVIMNKKKWEALPADIKAIIEKVNSEWIEKTAAIVDRIDKEGEQFAKQSGMKFITLSPAEDKLWAKAVKPALNEYTKNMKAKNLPGEKVLKFCQDYIKTHQQ